MDEVALSWQKNFLNNYGTPNIKLLSGKGVWVKDSNNKKYLDFLGGIAVSALGHSHKNILKAIKKQSKQILHTSNLYENQPSLDLAEKLRSLTKREAKIFFCNSGAEANEAAMKLTRLASKKSTISLHNSFHGRTMGSLSLTGQKAKQKGFEPLLDNINFVEPNNLDDLIDKSKSGIGSIFFEPIQGEGGVVDLSSQFLEEMKNTANIHDAYLVADEVQTGIGRCGYWFLSEGLNLEPDVIVLAKGLAGGLPIGAIMVFGELQNFFNPGSHGSTFGGNPLSCASALAVLKTIKDENLLENTRLRGEQLVRNLLSHPQIKTISGAGLLRGVHLHDAKAKRVVEISQASGLLVNAVSDSIIRLAPPLIVSRYEIDLACQKLASAIEQA
jgi:acetylornithine/N-succinyldiaminopimelate aminotransferase